MNVPMIVACKHRFQTDNYWTIVRIVIFLEVLILIYEILEFIEVRVEKITSYSRLKRVK